jgi:flagellar hook assembly protein FlgD
LSVTPRVFAPDRGEDATFTVKLEGANSVDDVFITARVYSADGRLVRVLYEDALRDVAGSVLAASPDDRWDGRDAGGNVMPGGVYVVSFEWGLTRGERNGRATGGVAVAR